LVDRAMQSKPQAAPQRQVARPRPPGPTFEQMEVMRLQQKMVRKQNPINDRKEPETENMILKMGIEMLLAYARQGSVHDQAIDLIWSQVPESQIKSFLCQPDSIEKLIAINKGVAEYKDWFVNLGEHMKASLGMESKYAADYENDAQEENAPAGESGVTVSDFPTEPPITSEERLSIAGDRLTLDDNTSNIAVESLESSAENETNV